MPLTGFSSLCQPKQSVIVSRDKGQSRTHTAKNKQLCQVSHYQVDGQIFKGSGSLKCDFLLLNDDKQNAYFIELKGADIDHAIDQLEASVKALQPMLPGYTIKYRIVFSHARTQAINGTKFKRFKKKHPHSDEFIYQKDQMCEDI